MIDIIENMGDETENISVETNLEYHVNALFAQIEALKKNPHRMVACNRILSSNTQQQSLNFEIRSLEFWRSIASECLATFLYVFIVCGALIGTGVGASLSSVLLSTALASGLTMMTLTHCFINISGAHVNPAVSIACCATKIISPIRALFYITAQCGGGIAGAALLYSVSRGYQAHLHASVSQNTPLPPWESFGVELILTFIVVLSFLMATESVKRINGNSPIFIGAAYSACSFVSMPFLNPACSLGPSFVLNKWENHWAHWGGSLFGGFVAGMVYQFIFKKASTIKYKKEINKHDSLSIHSENDINSDVHIDKTGKFQLSNHRTPTNDSPSVNVSSKIEEEKFTQNLYSTSPIINKYEQEPLYGGTRSMYCRSPTLTRSNLNRSHSVYAKTNTIVNREAIQQPGPLVPAQSLLPLRSLPLEPDSNPHLENQNMQNFLQLKGEDTYGIRQSKRNVPPMQQKQKSAQQMQNYQQQPQLLLHQQQLQQYSQNESQLQRMQQHQYHQQAQENSRNNQHSLQQFRQQCMNQNDNSATSFYLNCAPQKGPTNELNPKYQRRPEAIYRNRGQSDNNSPASYNDTNNGSSNRTQYKNDSPMFLYAQQSSPCMIEPIGQQSLSDNKMSVSEVESQPGNNILKNSNYSYSSKTESPLMQPSPQQNQQQQKFLHQHNSLNVQ